MFVFGMKANRKSNNCSLIEATCLRLSKCWTTVCRPSALTSPLICAGLWRLVSDPNFFTSQWNKTLHTQLWHMSNFTQDELWDWIVHVDVLLFLWLSEITNRLVSHSWPHTHIRVNTHTGTLSLYSHSDVCGHNAAQLYHLVMGISLMYRCGDADSSNVSVVFSLSLWVCALLRIRQSGKEKCGNNCRFWLYYCNEMKVISHSQKGFLALYVTVVRTVEHEGEKKPGSGDRAKEWGNLLPYISYLFLSALLET